MINFVTTGKQAECESQNKGINKGIKIEIESHSPVLCCCYILLSISSPAFSPFLSYFPVLCVLWLYIWITRVGVYVILKAKVEIMLSMENPITKLITLFLRFLV